MPAKKAFGAQFKWKVSTVYTVIANITKIKPFDMKAIIIDASSHDSPAEFKEKLGGFKDNGMVQLDLNYSNADAQHFAALANLGTLQDCEIIWPGTVVSLQTTAQFFAIVEQISAELPHDNKITATIQLQISGVITWS